MGADWASDDVSIADFCYHERDYAVNTNVMQADGQILSVNDGRTIGERIKWAREKRELTQGALGKLAGCGQTAIANYESGARGSPRKLNPIAKALQVSPDWLETGRGNWAIDAVSEPDENVPKTDEARYCAAVIDRIQSAAVRQAIQIIVMREALDRSSLVPRHDDDAAAAVSVQLHRPSDAPG